jgi:Na+-transporting methylmalonyl-CoA/oxaloacetate decarboxylase gamma subunit
MATVFAFLGLLLGLMQGSAALFEAFGHRFPVPPSTETTPRASDGAARDEEIAIVLAAVDAHRRKRRGA